MVLAVDRVLENAVDEVGIEPITGPEIAKDRAHTCQVRGRRSLQDRATGEGIRDAHHQPAQEYLPTATLGSMTYSGVEMKRSVPCLVLLQGLADDAGESWRNIRDGGEAERHCRRRRTFSYVRPVAPSGSSSLRS